MEKYIFFTPSINKIGGAEEYINKKYSRLENANYMPFIFYSSTEPILIPNLKSSRRFLFEELGLCPFYFSKKQQDKLLNKIIEILQITTEDNVSIESTEISMCEWGELLANKINAKHVCIILQEQHPYRRYFQNFLFFKYNRNELYGINEKSISLMMPEYKQIFEQRYINAQCIDVVEDVEYEFLHKIPKTDYNIGSIGRLEKNFVLYGAKQVALFASLNSDKNFNLILIGDGPEECKTAIYQSFKNVKNVNIFITGYIYPIPEQLIKKVDCFYSSSGSARITGNLNIPTISMSSDGDPIGILYYTTSQTLDKEVIYEKIELADYLKMIIIEKYCTKATPIFSLKRYDFDSEFKRQLSFFNKNVIPEYYPIRESYEINNKAILYRIVSYLFGQRFFVFILKKMNKIKRKLL